MRRIATAFIAVVFTCRMHGGAEVSSPSHCWNARFQGDAAGRLEKRGAE